MLLSCYHKQVHKLLNTSSLRTSLKLFFITYSLIYLISAIISSSSYRVIQYDDITKMLRTPDLKESISHKTMYELVFKKYVHIQVTIFSSNRQTTNKQVRRWQELPMYIITVHTKTTLLPTAPSMFQNQNGMNEA